MADQNSIQPFYDFRKSLSSARYDELKSRPDVKVESEDAFEEMRQYLLELYEDVEVQHTFLESVDHIVDCIPIEQQPSVRNSGQKVLDPPTSPLAPAGTYAVSLDTTSEFRKALPPQLHPDYRDSLGNQMWCPEGNIPMMRITLEQVSRLRNLHAFLGGEITSDVKKWATGAQEIDNIGGSSYINIWKPRVFGVQNSAAQQWYSTPREPFVTWQSVECGWRVGTPREIFNDDPRLFVFYTPDDYTTKHYNLLTTHGFEQISKTVLPGGKLPVSQPGGDQFDCLMGFFLTGNAWWYNVNGEWVGYYRTSLFGDGRLASGSGLVSFGGETSGVGAFPAMGSGRFPSRLFQWDAYQRNIFITPTGGAAQPANLTPEQQFPSCYNTIIANNSPTTWGTHMYFGGPGGVGCN